MQIRILVKNIKMFNSANYNSIELNTADHTEISYFKSLTDTLSLIEIVNKKVIKKYVSDTIVLVDSITRSVGKMISDTSVVIAIANKNIIKKFVNDNITNVDSITRKFTRILTLETLSASDTLSKSVKKFGSEVISLLDTIVTEVLRSFRKPKVYVKKLYNHSSISKAIRSVTRIIR